MKHIVPAILTTTFLALASALVLSAQPAASAGSAVPAGSGFAALHGCGTFLFNDSALEARAAANTAARNPGLYRAMLERSRSKGPGRTVLGGNDEFNQFFVLNRVSEQFDQIAAKLIYKGRRARIWIDLQDTLRVKTSTIAALARGLDSATAAGSRDPGKGVIENDEDVFGLPPANRFDAATPNVEDFLLTDIQDGLTGGNVLGYFSPYDQTDNPGSNQMNILYIDSREGIGNQNAGAIASLVSTLAHEYQHLIHFRYNPNSETFFNEGCSEAASTICGYNDRDNTLYLTASNIPLLRWSNDSDFNSLEVDYERAMTFIRYNYEQFGETFLKKFVATQSTGMNRIAAALTQIGSTVTWQNMLKGFMVANYVRKSFSDPQYTYRLALSSTFAHVTNSYNGTFPATGQVTLQQYAPAYNYYNFTKQQGMTIRFNGTQPFKAMALLYRNGALLEIRELMPNQPNTIEANPGYSRMVFVICNLYPSSQTVNWNVESIASGVEDAADAANTLAIAGVSPNPATGPMHVAYRAADHGPVTVSLFDLQGRELRTMVDAEQSSGGLRAMTFDTGALPGGVYMIRLEQSGHAVSRAVVVQR
ncbi:MAG: T9SS type A sorting domain-containing protein [Bacteroidetes bacterium]|nr:T9SS type A sorting domain-containing protein [Bacteroidota bacterium]